MKKLLSEHKRAIITIVLCVIGSFLLGWYVSALTMIAREARKLVWNPLSYGRYIRYYGFPTKTFWICSGVILTITLYRAIKHIVSTANKDERRNFMHSKSEVYGTAEELTEKDMEDLATPQNITKGTGPILGQMDQTAKRVIMQLPKMRINKHVLIFGASQSGKTFCYVLPNALQAARRRESVIMTDPKGELYETTSDYYRKLGYTVRRFDLKDPLLSDGWDCLKEVTNSSTMPEDRASIFADIVIQNTQGPGGSSGGIYEDGPKLLLKSLLLRAALDPDLIEKGKTSATEGNHIGQCIEYIKDPRGAEYIDTEVFNEQTVPLEARSCLTAYNSFKQASPNLYGNLVTGLAARLGVFDSNTVKVLTGTDDIDLTLPGKQPCAYYVIMSDMHSTLNFIGALFFSFLFLDLVEYADSQPSKRCKVPVNFLLDEFANIGSIPDFDKKMAVIRSRALNVSIILQDLNQLANRYPHTYKSIMSNCATHLCIGFNDSDTATYYSQRAGNMTVEVRTDQHAESEPLFQFGHKHSTGAGSRSMYAMDELIRFSFDECLISFQSKNVKRAWKFPVTSHPENKYLNALKILGEDYPHIDDPEAKREFRKKEREYQRDYVEWCRQHPDDPLHYADDIYQVVQRYCKIAKNAYGEASIECVRELPIWKEKHVTKSTETSSRGQGNGLDATITESTGADSELATGKAYHNVTISQSVGRDVVKLQDLNITGNLVLKDTEASVQLKNVTIEGHLIIRGDTRNTIKLENVNLKGNVKSTKGINITLHDKGTEQEIYHSNAIPNDSGQEKAHFYGFCDGDYQFFISDLLVDGNKYLSNLDKPIYTNYEETDTRPRSSRVKGFISGLAGRSSSSDIETIELTEDDFASIEIPTVTLEKPDEAESIDASEEDASSPADEQDMSEFAIAMSQDDMSLGADIGFDLGDGDIVIDQGEPDDDGDSLECPFD